MSAKTRFRYGKQRERCLNTETLESRLTLSTSGFSDSPPVSNTPLVGAPFEAAAALEANIPDQVFAPYVDTTLWPPFDFVQMARDQNVKYFTLAFVVADPTTSEPSWGGYYSVSSGYRADEIQELRSLGGEVLVSFGGAAGTELAAAITDVNALTNAYQSVIDQYDLTWIDFDIEGAWVADRDSIDRRSAAIRNLQDQADDEGRALEVWFTLPVLPTGLTNDGLYVITSALSHGVDIGGVNIMAMDYGDSAAPNPEGQMGEYAIQAASSLFQQMKEQYSAVGMQPSQDELWSKVGVTPMIGQNDVLSERFYLEDARELLNFANANRLGMLSQWSTNRDAACATFGQLALNCSGVPQSPFEFSQTLNQFTGNEGPLLPALSIRDVSTMEGDNGSSTIDFTIELSFPSNQDVSVHYSTSDHTAVAPTDYEASSGVLILPAGQTQTTLSIEIYGDTAEEQDESFLVSLSSPSNAVFSKSSASGSIVDDDQIAPRHSFVYETTNDWGSGFNGQFSITNNSDQPWTNWQVEFAWTHAINQVWNGVLIEQSGNRYTIENERWNGQVNPGQTITVGFGGTPGNVVSAPTNVKINGTGVDELPETLDPVEVSIEGGLLEEPAAGSAALNFQVRLSRPLAGDETVTVQYNTLDATARKTEDYDATTGELIFLPGDVEKSISVMIHADTVQEQDETFQLVLSDVTNARFESDRATGLIVDRRHTVVPEIAWRVTSQWDSGYVAELVITNTTELTWTDWGLDFELPAEISSLWGGQITTREGSRYSVRSESWNRTLAPGQSITIGFVAKGNPIEPLDMMLLPSLDEDT